MEHSEYYDDLIVRYLAQETTRQEEQELFSLIRTSDEFAEHFLIMKNIWEQTGNPDEYSARKLSEDLDKVDARIRRLRYRNFFTVAFRYFQKAAAILIIPLIALTAVLLKGSFSKQNSFIPETREITAMPGSRMYTLLPDSTEVWINGGTSVRYSRTNAEGRRIVDIEGEAFFKVAHDANHPFVVNSRNLSVEALGTEFNVCSYPSDSLTTVTLTEGSVLITDSLSQSVLAPGQMIIYNENLKCGRLFLGNTEKNTLWRHGRLVFKNEPLCNVYKRLGQIYGMKFEVDPKLRDVLFYATFEDASLEQIMQLIKKSTSLEYVSDDSRKAAGDKYIIRVKPRS